MACKGQGFKSPQLHHSSVFKPRPAKEQVEGRPVVNVGDVAVADLDAVDDGAVEQLAGRWVGVTVGGATVGGEPPSGLQDGPPFAQVCCEGAAAGFGPGPLADSALFLAEQAQVDGVGVVGLQQLAPLTIQAHQFTVQLLVLVGGLALAGVDLSLEGAL
jgi:hypothetical protein